MAADPSDIGKLTDRELGEHIYGLTIEIAAYRNQIESLAGTRKRTVRLARSTILMVGGLYGAALDLWALVLTILGLWDWFDSVTEDATFTNHQIDVLQHLADLEFRLALATSELRKREANAAGPQ